MRISSSMIYTQSVTQMDNLGSALQTTTQEVSSGLKDLTGQNATLASQVLKIQQMQDINNQYTSNRVTARASLQQVDSTLGSASKLLTSLKTLVVQAQNGSIGASDRSAIAGQVQADLTQLQTLANTADASGHYILAGYQSGVQPYMEIPAGSGTYVYQGDQGQRSIEVAQGQYMPTSVAGSAVFGSGNTSIFNQLSSLAKTLNSPIAGYQSPNLTPAQNALLVTPAQQAAQYTADLTAANGNIDQALNNVTNTNVTIGDNEQQLNAMDTQGANLNISYKQMMSTVGDVDMVQAISTLNQQQLALTAAEKSFAQVSSISLFNYIK